MAQLRSLGCIIASAITIIAGVVLLIGASTTIRDTNVIHDAWGQIYSLSIFSIIISILTIIFAIALIYVVNRQFPALTTVFSISLIITAFLALLCAVILLNGRSGFEERSYNTTQDLFRNYSDSDQIKSSKSMLTYIQQSFECCGVEEATDWKNTYSDGKSTPDSCCKTMIADCGKNSLVTQEKIYTRGCAEPIYIAVRKKYTTLIGMNFVVMIFAIVSGTLGIVFERYIRQQYQQM